jgi:hypothetical protein
MKENNPLIQKILQDPVLLRRLSDQVYQLLLNDLYLDRDRFSQKR